MWLLVLLLPQFWILLFNDDPALLEVGVKTLRIYYATFVFMNFQMMGRVPLWHWEKPATQYSSRCCAR